MEQNNIKLITEKYLKDELGFKESVVMDIPLKTYGLKTEEIADFIVEYSTGEEICPLIVVLCIDSDDISDEAVDKLMDLSDMTMAEYAIVTNGKVVQMYEYDGKENAYYLLNEPLTKIEIEEIFEEE